MLNQRWHAVPCVIDKHIFALPDIFLRECTVMSASITLNGNIFVQSRMNDVLHNSQQIDKQGKGLHILHSMCCYIKYPKTDLMLKTERKNKERKWKTKCWLQQMICSKRFVNDIFSLVQKMDTKFNLVKIIFHMKTLYYYCFKVFFPLCLDGPPFFHIHIGGILMEVLY